MVDETPNRLQTLMWNVFRIVVALAFMSHGVSKTFGWLGGWGPEGQPAELMSRWGVSGVLETFGGSLFLVGLFTRPVAFLLSGEMAVAYFWIHFGGEDIWWWSNRGELAMLYCFIFLLFSVHGGGTFSLDAAWRGRRDPADRSPAPPVD